MTYTLRRKTSVGIGNMRWDVFRTGQLSAIATTTIVALAPVQATATTGTPSAQLQGAQGDTRKMVVELLQSMTQPKPRPGYAGSPAIHRGDDEDYR